MSYKYVESDLTHFAKGLITKDGEDWLKWDCAKNQDTLIVRTSYGCTADNYMEEICRLLSERDLDEARKSFVEWGKDFRIRIVTASEKNKMDGCPMNGRACRYTVFGIDINDEDSSRGTVYYSKQEAMSHPEHDIQLKIKIDVSMVPEKKGFLGIKKRNKGEPFFQITFPNELAVGYVEKSLMYSVGSFEVPVTNEMICEGTVYVRSTEFPRIVSKNRGLELL